MLVKGIITPSCFIGLIFFAFSACKKTVPPEPSAAKFGIGAHVAIDPSVSSPFVWRIVAVCEHDKSLNVECDDTDIAYSRQGLEVERWTDSQDRADVSPDTWWIPTEVPIYDDLQKTMVSEIIYMPKRDFTVGSTKEITMIVSKSDGSSSSTIESLVFRTNLVLQQSVENLPAIYLTNKALSYQCADAGSVKLYKADPAHKTNDTADTIAMLNDVRPMADTDYKKWIPKGFTDTIQAIPCYRVRPEVVTGQ